MQNDKAYSEILASITTEDEKDRLTSLIEELSAALYKTDSTQYQKKLGEVDLKVGEIIKTVPSGDLPQFLATLKEKLIATPSVKVTLSFKPTKDFVEKISKIIGGIVEVQTDPDIIGGAVIEANGKQLDFSLKTKIQKLI